MKRNLTDGVDAARDIGVFSIEADRGVDSSDGFERRAAEDEVAALHHGADAQDVSVDDVGGGGSEIEDLDEEALAGGELVVDERPGERGKRRVAVKGPEHAAHPAGREATVGVDVGDERSGAGDEAGRRAKVSPLRGSSTTRTPG